MKNYNSNKNVYEATQERIEYIFNEFDNILVAFSGGKDSGVCLNLFYQYAKKHNLFNKLATYFQDYEAGYSHTFDFVERIFESMPEIKRYWLCLPIRAACSVSMYSPFWIPWNNSEKSIWVRDIPNKPYVIDINNIWFPFKEGTSGFDFRIIFADEFSKQYGKTAVIVGIRTDESLSRLSILTSSHRNQMYNYIRWSKGKNKVYNFYPIYDWKTEDIWIANYKFNWDYNKLYDLYYQAGLSLDQMRTASPFHACGQTQLKLYRVICPDIWGKMVSRVNGVNFTGIYGGTKAMGWKNVTKPAHLSWKEYAEFLINTLPEENKKKIMYHLNRLQISWEKSGYGRNPDVIKQMEKEGIVLEKTGKISKLCTKDNIYQIVKIKNGFPEDTQIEDFRHCPSWKRICITILKNDFGCTYLGCGRTKNDISRRNKIINKYKNIL